MTRHKPIMPRNWQQSEQAATNYFGCYERATKAYFPNICEEEKIQLSNVQNKAELAVISILEASKDQIPFSKTLMDSIRSSGYPGDSAILHKVRDIREISERQIYLSNQHCGKQTALPDCKE